jgi:transposase InsO family protein
MDNGHIESFNGRLRDEFLNVNQFLSIEDAKPKSKLGGSTTIGIGHMAHSGT